MNLLEWLQEKTQSMQENLETNTLIGIWNGLEDDDTEAEDAVKVLMSRRGYTLTRNTEDGSWVWDQDVEVGDDA